MRATIGYISVLLAVGMTLGGCGAQKPEPSFVRSLTGDDFTGQKYYFGWGAAGRGDPQMMHNEVKYDVLHTHDIFTEQVGGSYIGTKEIGTHVNRNVITSKWNELRSVMTEDDMYVQYSSGHGYSSGLAVGVSYDDIRNNALSYPAKEIIIFTMACYSGGLVNSFDRVRSQWADWADQGRTLLVMSSSTASQTSSTGPGRDPDEPGGPSGSAGSAFGHALWKALIGYADGYVDGVKDGYISLEEIKAFATWKTYRVGRHTPQVTGVYNPHLVMNRVPPREFLDALESSTEGLSEEEIMQRVQELNEALAVR